MDASSRRTAPWCDSPTLSRRLSQASIRSRFLARFAGASAPPHQLFEHAPAFEAAWVIQEWHTTPKRRARAVARIEPAPSASGSDAAGSWAGEFLDQAEVPAADAELWQTYCDVARALAE